MAGINKQFDRDKVLASALNVFWAKGYAATSMQDLVDAMSINRASMYNTFGNKQALFDLAFSDYRKTAIQGLNNILEQPGSTIENLKKMIFIMLSNEGSEENYGCFVNNIAIELGPHDESIAKKVREFWRDLEKLFDKHLHIAVLHNELSIKLDPQETALIINIFIQGLMAKSKAQTPHAQMKRSIDTFFELLMK